MTMEAAQELVYDIEGFDPGLIIGVKTGFKPLFVRNPLTTVYQGLTHALYEVKPDAYLPRSFMWLGLGWGAEKILPVHGLDRLHSSQHMHSILSRNPSISFEDYLLAMSGLSDEIEACHLVKVNVDLKNLIMLVLSSGQIIDILLLFYEERLTPEVDRICSSELHILWVDFLLVQNQVPFFALQKMYDMVNYIPDHTTQRYPPLLELCLFFFEKFLKFNRQSAPPLVSTSIHHLLHLVHYYVLPPNNPPDLSRGYWSKQFAFTDYLPSILQRRVPERIPTHVTGTPVLSHLIMESIPSARRLQEAGVRFQKKKEPGFSKITFHKGVLQLPFLYVDKNTEPLLRNMAAWEQCHFNYVGGYFTSYCILMDYLINSVEDVEILEREGIMEQTLGSEKEVAFLFNGLSTNLVYIADQNEFLPRLCMELNEYSRNRFNLWRAKLMVDYFSSPWAVISVVAAIFLLLMTATQTFYTAYGYHQPHN